MKSLMEHYAVLPFDKAAAAVAAQAGASLRKSGSEIEIRDLLIASICISNNIPLLTRKRSHYARIDSLKVLLD